MTSASPSRRTKQTSSTGDSGLPTYRTRAPASTCAVTTRSISAASTRTDASVIPGRYISIAKADIGVAPSLVRPFSADIGEHRLDRVNEDLGRLTRNVMTTARREDLPAARNERGEVGLLLRAE